MKISGISAARRRSHRRCGCAVAKRLHGGVFIVAALLGLFWRLLTGGEVESCEGEGSWQPEIGMEHASRGRRSGNKGVGARWRGRFRIFSARHCSRTKVSHAENSGMTMSFFSWSDCSGVGGGFFHTLGSGHSAPCRLRRGGTRLKGCFRAASGETARGRKGASVPPQERRHEEERGLPCRLRRGGTRKKGGFRAASGEAARGRKGASVPPQERRHEEERGLPCRLRRGGTRKKGGFRAASGEAARGRKGASVPPQERRHEEERVLPCRLRRGGTVSEERGLPAASGEAARGRKGASVPPQERRHEEERGLPCRLRRGGTRKKGGFRAASGEAARGRKGASVPPQERRHEEERGLPCRLRRGGTRMIPPRAVLS